MTTSMAKIRPLGTMWVLLVGLALVAAVGCDTDEEEEGRDVSADAGGDAGNDADTGSDLTVDFGLEVGDTSPDTQCTAEPVCGPGETEVEDSSACLQDDAVCYQNTMCGRTIWCTGPDAPELRFLRGGYRFGECLGICQFELSLVDDVLTLTLSGWREDDPSIEEAADLTEAGVAEIEAILSALSEESLEDTYGCPDCDDGGEAYAVLLRGADESRHAWEFSEPPVVLEALDAFIVGAIESIEACESTERLVVAEDCVPYE